MGLRAVIVYLHVERLPNAFRWCASRGYEVVGLVTADRWRDAAAMTVDGQADLLVAASMDAVDPDRLPRLEVVEWPGPPPG